MKKKSNVTLGDKYRCIMLIERKVKSRSEMSREMGLHETTITKWMRDDQRAKIKQAYEESHGQNSNRFIIKRSKYEILNAALFEWYSQRRAINPLEEISNSMLVDAAQRLAPLLNQGRFQANDTWLVRFKKNYGIRQKPDNAIATTTTTGTTSGMLVNGMPSSAYVGGGPTSFEAAMSQFMGGVATSGGVIIPRTDEQIAQDILNRYSGGMYPPDAFDPAQAMSGHYMLDDDDDDDDDTAAATAGGGHHHHHQQQHQQFNGSANQAKSSGAAPSGSSSSANNRSVAGAVTGTTTADFMRAHTNLPTRTELNHCMSRIRLFCLNHYVEFQHELRWMNELEAKINRIVRN